MHKRTKLVEDMLKSVSGDYGLMAKVIFEPVDCIELRPDVIFNIVRNKKVLHLGCTDHSSVIDWKINNDRFLHKQLSDITRECLGIDINTAAAEYLKKYDIDNIIIKDITTPGIEEILSSKWDYLLMAEMLEHVDDPVAFLKSIAKEYKNNIERIIITVPNAFGLIHLIDELKSKSILLDTIVVVARWTE